MADFIYLCNQLILYNAKKAIFYGMTTFAKLDLKLFNNSLLLFSLNLLIGPEATKAPTNILLLEITGTAIANNDGLCSLIDR